MFHSLDDYKNKDEDEQAKKDKRKTTDSYAGGKSSGIAVENPEDDREGFAKTKDKITIKLYRNGFILDDGPFRPLSDPENKKFMDEIERKILPEELVRKGFKNVGVAIQKSDKDYVEPIPEKKFEAFKGQGQSLGKVDTTGLKVNTNVSSSFDKSKPTCKVNIRLFNGQMVTEEFNLTQKLKDVVKFVEKASGSNKFSLLDGFPPRPLTAMDKTIEELKLQGSTLTQRLG